MVLHRLRDRAEDHAGLGQLLLEGGDHGHAIEHGVDRNARRALDAGEQLLLLQRDAELGVGLEQLRIDLGEALRPFGALRRGIVIEILEVDLGVVHVGPGRLLHGQPAAIGLEPPLEQPVGLALLRRDEADDLLVEALRGLDRFDVGVEAVFVLVDVDLADAGDGLLHCRHGSTPNPFRHAAVNAASWRCRIRLISSLKALEESLDIGTHGAKTKAHADRALRKLLGARPWRSTHARPRPCPTSRRCPR